MCVCKKLIEKEQAFKFFGKLFLAYIMFTVKDRLQSTRKSSIIMDMAIT